MSDTDRDHVVHAASGRLALFFLRGAEAAPGAVAFDLIALDTDGSSTGAGATVCRDCVSRVGAEAFARTFGTSPPADPEPGTRKAVVDVGAAPAYDLVPQSELQYDTYCAECEQPIIGNHIHACNGRSYIAGPREGRACSCTDIRRLHKPRAGRRGGLEDQDGTLYVERTALMALVCDACLEPIRPGEPCYASMPHTKRLLCCRCTIVY
jgi:hypothetical protein